MALHAPIKPWLLHAPSLPAASFLLECSIILCGSWAQPMRRVAGGQRAERCIEVFILLICLSCLKHLVQFCLSVFLQVQLSWSSTYLPISVGLGVVSWECFPVLPLCAPSACMCQHGMQMCSLLCMPLEIQGRHQVSISMAIHLIFETGVTHWMWSSGWACCKSPGSTCLCLPSNGVTSACSHAQLLHGC